MIRNLALATLSLIAGLLLLEGSLWLLGVQPALLREDPFVGFSGQLPLFEPGGDGRQDLVTAPNKLDVFNLQRFPAQKAAGTTRIFCLGGSTTYGRPYGDRTSFCGWLRALLPHAVPSRHWEVVNAGGISYASYRVAALMQELRAYEPDLFIVYSGHNEFLEERTYRQLRENSPALAWLRLRLNGTRLYTALREALGREVRDARSVLPAEVDTVLDRSVGPSSYERDDGLRSDVLSHYELNLRRIVEIGRAADAEVLLIVPASNLRHCSPFKSQPGEALDDSEARRVKRLWALAREARAQGRLEAALETAEEATALDPRQARSHYLRAKLLDALGRYDDARAAYVRAREEDVCPLRALSDIEATALRVARETDAPSVDFARLVRERAAAGIPGDDLFVDHVHPTIDAHRLLALAVIDALQRRGFLRLDDAWTDARVEAIARELEASLDGHYHGRAFANLSRVLGWAGKQEEAYRAALRAVALVPDSADAQYQAGSSAFRSGRTNEALVHYREAVRLDPGNARAQNNLGHMLAARGQVDEALLHYRAALRADPQLAAAHYNLGRALAGRREDAAARRHLETALRLDPDRPEVHFELAAVLARAGDRAAARRALERALVLRPRWARAQSELARLNAGGP